MPPTNTEVEIFGAVYQRPRKRRSEYLQSLADLVDRKMREVAQHVRATSTRIAILAALNLADELFRAQKTTGRGTGRDQGEGGGADRGIKPGPQPLKGGKPAPPAQRYDGIEFASPVRFVMGTTIVEPTTFPREFYHLRGLCQPRIDGDADGSRSGHPPGAFQVLDARAHTAARGMPLIPPLS